MTRRAHLAVLKATVLRLIDVWLEPRALLGEVIGCESSEIAAHVEVQVGLDLQGFYHMLRGIKTLGDLVEDVIGIHLGAPDNLRHFLGRHVPNAIIAGMRLGNNDLIDDDERQSSHRQQH